LGKLILLGLLTLEGFEEGDGKYVLTKNFIAKVDYFKAARSPL
jgi:hypothetical protein